MRCLAMARPIRPTPMMPTRSLSLAMICSDPLPIRIVIAHRTSARHIAFRHILLDRRAVAFARIAVTPTAGGLNEEALPGLHLVTARGGRLMLRIGPEPGDAAAAAAPFPPGRAGRR